MKIIIDSREQKPYNFRGCDTIVKGLKTGDYSAEYNGVDYSDKIALERKSLADFIGSITSGRKRFEKEIMRAKELEYFAIIIEGSWEDIEKHNYRSQMPPESVIGTILGWAVKFNVPIILAGNRRRAEKIVKKKLEFYLRYKTIIQKKIELEPTNADPTTFSELI